MVGFGILDRYFLSSIVRTLLLTAAAFSALLFFSLILEELKSVGQHHYTLWTALLYVLAVLPASLYELIPLVFLIAFLAAMGAMAGRSELIVLQSSGLSAARLFLMASKSLVLVYLCVALVGELWAPQWMNWANQTKAQLMGQPLQMTGKNALWIKTDHGLLYIQSYQPDGVLKQISFYEISPLNSLTRVVYAQRAEVHDSEASTWRLQEVEEIRVQLEADERPRLIKKSYAQLDNQLLVAPENLQAFVQGADTMGYWQLRDYVNFLESADIYPGRYAIEFYRKWAQPVLILALAYLVFPLVLGSVRQVSMGQQVFVGLMLGIAIVLFQQFIENWVLIHQWNYWVAVLALPGGLLLVGSYLFLADKRAR
jgi:lipopolysaccharide export system permease protein